VFAYAKDFSATLRSALAHKGQERRQSLARNDGKKFDLDLREKPLSQCSGTASSPFGGGANIKVNLIIPKNIRQLLSE
jgi:hypothetical protein